MKRKDPVTRIEWLVVFRRHMKRSPRTNSLGNFWGTLIGMFSALYCADNIGPANRFLSLGQYAMTELGLPTWLAEILVFGAIVIPGMLLGGYVQNWGRRRFFDAQDTPSAFLGQIIGGIVGFAVTASILTRQGEIGGVYVIDPSFHQAVNFLMGWIIFVGPVVIGILLGGYLHRKIRN